MAATCVLSTVAVPRRFRFRLWDIRAAKWLVPAWRCFTLPLALKRKRFLVPLCVFCLGIADHQPSHERREIRIHHYRRRTALGKRDRPKSGQPSQLSRTPHKEGQSFPSYGSRPGPESARRRRYLLGRHLLGRYRADDPAALLAGRGLDPADILQLLQDELKPRHFFLVRLAHDDNGVARGEHASGVGLKLD